MCGTVKAASVTNIIFIKLASTEDGIIFFHTINPTIKTIVVGIINDASMVFFEVCLR